MFVPQEFEIIDFFIGSSLNDEVLKIMPVQKQTRAGQRTRFKAFVGKYNILIIRLLYEPRQLLCCIQFQIKFVLPCSC